ncbi:BTAD domain-containing putative transcriptional regulator [Nonomuraea sp. LPB2021202275-12-8]|uniref:BTAD domain-containing putative transcriptional regulator n=1 Tax=Nonomuraea sp. LPB2021202275-12-8 TaxID=3120159 RepID=UPI00300D5219
MRFGILGPVEAWSSDGVRTPTGGPRLRAVLALLLVDADRVVSVERLVAALYGDMPPPAAANALQSQVSRLRRRLSAEIEFNPAGYRLAIDPGHVDAHRFERLAREGGQALAAGDFHKAADVLGEGLRMWRGPALADVREVPFAAMEADRLEELRVTAVEDRAEAALALGRQGDLVPELRAMVAAHPLRERLRAQLMRALDGAGRQAEALAVFDDARRTLAEELGADPSAELARAHLAVLRAEPAARPGLPAQLTGFVGRAEDLARVGALLGTARLVTLTGPGGVGKTRLAIEAARRQAGEVCFVDLAPLDHGAEVPQAVIAALGLRASRLLPPGSPEPAARLVAGLADRALLLVLDNCEHVIGEVSRLIRRLLSACPRLRVLATSREVLGITGESLCAVSPLAVPGRAVTAEEALGHPAVRLFADRAAPAFVVDDAGVGAVVRICAALDGLPLAIELAAARLRALTVHEVAARLDDRFGLLSRGDRTAAPRHQTLRAVIRWSWDLLEPDEQVLARRLTVFAGGATLETAERVCGLPGTADLMAALVDKSLVEAAGGRYTMLETVRAFGAERLAEAGEQDTLRRAHATCFHDLAETADLYLRGARQLEWMAALAAEQGNLHAALRWAGRTDPSLGLRLAAALSWFWWLGGLRHESVPLTAGLVAALPAGPPAELAEEYLLCVADSASPELEQAKSAVIARGRPLRRPHALFLYGMAIAPMATDPAEWAGVLGPDAWAQATIGLSEGYRLLVGGDAGEAEATFLRSLDGFRSTGDRWGIAIALDRLAQVAERRDDHARSRALTGEALALLARLGAAEDTADLLTRRAYGLLRDGEHAAARLDYERAAELARTAGASDALAGAHWGLGELARLGGDLAGARRLFGLALEGCAGGALSTERTRYRTLIGLARIAQAEEDTAGARRRLHQALQIALDHPDDPEVAEVVAALTTGAATTRQEVRALLRLASRGA